MKPSNPINTNDNTKANKTARTNKVRWGILSTAKIAQEKMIPALHAAESSEVVAVASRNQAQADTFAKQANIPTAYGDYQQLLDDPNIDIIYNPLPNHLHVPWTIKAIEAGKHVLCEKPVGLDTRDVEKLIQVTKQHPHLKVMEAFMYRFHPQWALAKQFIDDGKIGNVHSIDAVFTYHNTDATNVRNMPNIGGGGLMDIGCYCISAARYLLEKEPIEVMGKLSIDTNFNVDKHANALLNFGDVRASLYCSTQSEPSQRVYISGETGSLTIELPFYQPNNCPAQLIVRHDQKQEVHTIEGCDHYVKQADALAGAIVDNRATPTPLSDALNNMKVIDAIFASHEEKAWVSIN
ncbi:MAG: Gfo/Idh/MocA family oxidoreductase [Colwellia sp.]